MITQYLLDFISAVLAAIVGLVPDMPPELDAALGSVSEGIAYFMGQITPLSYLIPFDAVAAVVTLAVVALGVWGTVLVIRLGLWLTTLWG